MKSLLTGCAIAAPMIYLIYLIASLPMVYTQYPTGECVRVYPTEYSCENLPDHYETIPIWE